MTFCTRETEGAESFWFVAQLKPNGLARAVTNLNRQGFRTFMPMQKVQEQSAKTTKQSGQPVFPGYLFVSFDPAKTQWRSINNTYGVAALITHGLSPRATPPSLVSRLMAGCDSEGYLLPPVEYPAGSRVRIVSGPFTNVVAEVNETSKGDRVKLLYDLMGRSAIIDCSKSQLRLLNDC